MQRFRNPRVRCSGALIPAVQSLIAERNAQHRDECARDGRHSWLLRPIPGQSHCHRLSRRGTGVQNDGIAQGKRVGLEVTGWRQLGFCGQVSHSIFLTKLVLSLQAEKQLRLPVSVGDQISVELRLLEDFAYGGMTQARRNRLFSLRNDIGQDGHDRTVGLEIRRVNLIHRVAGLMMNRVVGYVVDPKIERRNTLEHERALVAVEGGFQRDLVRSVFFQIDRRQFVQSGFQVVATLDDPPARAPLVNNNSHAVIESFACAFT